MSSIDVKSKLKELVKTYHRLNPKTRRVKIQWLVMNGANMAEIARQIGITRQRVHQLSRNAGSN